MNVIKTVNFHQFLSGIGYIVKWNFLPYTVQQKILIASSVLNAWSLVQLNCTFYSKVIKKPHMIYILLFCKSHALSKITMSMYIFTAEIQYVP